MAAMTVPTWMQYVGIGWVPLIFLLAWFLHRLEVTRPRIVSPKRERARRDVTVRREQAGELVRFPTRLRVVRDAVDECGDAVDASVFPFRRGGAA